MGLPALDTSKAPRGRTLLIFAPKGGVGKSTIAMNLLVAATQHGIRARGVDLDPQRTLSNWDAYRRENPFSTHLTPVEVVPSHINDWRSVWETNADYDLSIYDFPPGVEGFEDSIYSLTGRGDYALIPFGPGHELPHLIPWMKRLLERERKVAFCMTRVFNPNYTGARIAKTEAVKHGPCTPVDIPMRDDILRSSQGFSVFDHPKFRGRDEFQILWNHVCQELGL
jgi:ATPases involved in chromosome partitioning